MKKKRKEKDILEPTEVVPSIVPAVLAWEEPPARARQGHSLWEPVLEQLRQRPGVWAKVFEGSKDKAEMKRSGLKMVLKRMEGAFEVTLRSNGGQAALYVRFVE